MAEDDPYNGKAESEDSDDLAHDRTDMAEDRTVMAVERTFAGWIRTAFGAIAIGWCVCRCRPASELKVPQ